MTIADGATVIAALAAVVAASAAGMSYVLSRRIYEEIKSDEVVVVGPIHRVGYLEKDHDDPVVRVTLFNKSARKAFLTGIKCIDQNKQQIPITWSGSASRVGDIENPTGLVGIVDSVNIYIRRNDGVAIGAVEFHFTHSFSGKEIIVEFDPYQGWWQ